jgi:hypothetical protein
MAASSMRPTPAITKTPASRRNLAGPAPAPLIELSLAAPAPHTSLTPPRTPNQFCLVARAATSSGIDPLLALHRSLHVATR